MMKRVVAGCLVALAFAGFGAPSLAGERPDLETARKVVTTLADDAIRTWRADHPTPEARRRAMRNLIYAYFDVRYIVRGVLGRHWRELDESTRDQFQELLSTLVTDVYLPYLAKYERDRLRVLNARPRGKRDVLVRSEFRSDEGQWIDADWRIRARGGEPRIIDIVVAGVSLLLVQRQEFDSVIATKGVDGLMDDLRKQLVSLLELG